MPHALLGRTLSKPKREAFINKSAAKTFRRSRTTELLHVGHTSEQLFNGALPHRVQKVCERHQRKRLCTWRIQTLQWKTERLLHARQSRGPISKGYGHWTRDHDAIYVVDMTPAQEDNFDFFRTRSGCVRCFDTSRQTESNEWFINDTDKAETYVMQLRFHFNHETRKTHRGQERVHDSRSGDRRKHHAGRNSKPNTSIPKDLRLS